MFQNMMLYDANDERGSSFLVNSYYQSLEMSHADHFHIKQILCNINQIALFNH
jgi:hypothetical protein